MDLPIAPLLIPSWSSALAAIDDDPSHVDEQYRSANNHKYVFPEPGIFLGTNVVQWEKYLSTWQAIEAACIHQLLSSMAPSLSNQEWQDILIGSLEFKSSDSTCAKTCKDACCLLGSSIDDLNLNTMHPATLSSPPIDDLEAWVMLWHLSELNFRFELLALHKHSGTAGHDAVDSNQDVCNALQLPPLQAVDMVTSVEGFHSSDWRSHLPSLL
jgi:hypothetical protein